MRSYLRQSHVGRLRGNPTVRPGDVIGKVPAADPLSTRESELMRLGPHLERPPHLPKPATAWSAPCSFDGVLHELAIDPQAWGVDCVLQDTAGHCRTGEVPLVPIPGQMPLGMTSLRPCLPLSPPCQLLAAPCHALAMPLGRPSRFGSGPRRMRSAIPPGNSPWSSSKLPFHFPGLRFKLPGGVSSRNVGRTTGTTLVSRQLEAYWTKNGKAENSLDEVPASRVTEFDKAAELERRLLSSCSRPSWTHTVGPSLHAESHQTSSLWGHTRGDGTPSPRTGDPVQQFNRQGAGSPSVGGCSICAFNVTSFRGQAWCAFNGEEASPPRHSTSASTPQQGV